MFELVSTSIALVGSSIAGWYDLKTTEIPDWTSIGMIVCGLGINLLRSLLEWSHVYIFQSASVGAAFFTFAIVMYLGGQWGGGDAKVLAGIGALMPATPFFAFASKIFPFPFVLLVNIFVVGAIYIVTYAFVFAMIYNDLAGVFIEDIRNRYKKLICLSLLPVVALIILTVIAGPKRYFFNLIYLVPGVFGLFLLFRFLKVVELQGFTQEIKTENLEVGDMLSEPLEELETPEEEKDEMKEISVFLAAFSLLSLSMYMTGFTENIYFSFAIFSVVITGLLTFIYFIPPLREVILQSSRERVRGLKEEEVEKIQEEKDVVEIREGVRFAPVFPVGILLSIYVGNILFWIL